MTNVITWKIPASGGPAEPIKDQFTTLDLASKVLPNGGYTTFRTFDKSKALHFQDHLQRLQETARLSGFQIDIPEKQIREIIRGILPKIHASEARVRLTVDLNSHLGDVYASFEPLTIPSIKQYQHGVRVITCNLHRTDPKAKRTNFVKQADEIRRNMPEGIYEALMVDNEGNILEGLSSNFFAVKSGEVWTAEEGVLPGITRSIVLEEANHAGLTVHLSCVKRSDIPMFEEAFITSSSRAVLPVVEIDEQSIGSGKPGKITRLLQARYDRRIAEEIQPI